MTTQKLENSPLEGEGYLSLTEVEGNIVHERTDALRWTAERDIVEARYRFAIRCLRREGAKRVLDLGCGLGYGTWMLDRAGFDVVGVELSTDALTVAHARYPWIKFVQADMREFKHDLVQGVVACEVLEHIVDPKPFLRTVCDLLEPCGALVVTTPNAKYTVDSNNIFHEHEYQLQELSDTLGNPSMRALDSRLVKPARAWIALLGEERFMRLKYVLSRHFPLHYLPNYSRTLVCCTNRERLEAVLSR